MDKKNFAFDKMNFILLAVGMAVVVLGLILMSGPGSTETAFNDSCPVPVVAGDIAAGGSAEQPLHAVQHSAPGSVDG